MMLTLRRRILLNLAPLLFLLVVLGGAGTWMLYRMGSTIDAIMRDNYDSVVFMERLAEAAERIDTSFQSCLGGDEGASRQQYEEAWKVYEKNLDDEQHNITIPGEGELCDELTELTQRYRRQGDTFYGRPANDPQRQQDYDGPAGLRDTLRQIKGSARRIFWLNGDNMEQCNRDALHTARTSLLAFALGLIAVTLLAGYCSLRVVHTILQPIQAVTRSALGISAGNLDQIVPYLARDELGQLAEAFNSMARHLRTYRQSQLAELLRAQRTSQATIDSFPDPVLVVDSAGRVAMANPAAQRVLGVMGPKVDRSQPRRASADTALVEPWQAPAPLREPLSAALDKQLAYLPEGFDLAVPLPVEGREHFFLPRLLPIRDPFGHTLGAAVQLQDITRFRLLDEIKSNLVGTVSHELKTPLTSVRLALHLLLEETVGPLTPKQTEFVVDARDNAELLLARVNNLLDLTRFESGREQLDIRAERAEPLLRAAAEAVRPKAESKGVEIVMEVAEHLPVVAADATRLGHALENLLENAITYTDRGGRVTVTAVPAGQGIECRVTDTGIGIPAEHLPRVFDRFFRVPGQSRGRGSGLGLAIVREIITAHGGTIDCQSRPGAGTTFRLTLPGWNAG
jgi:NtrC-family two-component system sensor histidine kinase KinB